MNKTSESFTKFRTLSQPRIKSAQKLDPHIPQNSPIKQKNGSVKNFNQNKDSNDNPEMKKSGNFINTPKYDQKANANTQFNTGFKSVSNTNYPANINLFDEQPTRKISDLPQNKAKKEQYGRKLQYPVNRPEQRVMVSAEGDRFRKSFSSSHFRDSAQKSKKLIDERINKQQKIDKVFSYLLATNTKYLDQKRRLCCQKAKPHQQLFRFPIANLLSTYQDHYPPKNNHLDAGYYPEPQNKKQAFGLPQSKVCGNSTSHEFHNGRQQKRPDLATWPDGWKLQGPIWGPTTYSNHYPHNGDFDKMVPIAVWDKAPTGLDFVGDSNHRQSYKDPKSGPAKLATWNNMHPYGNDFNRQPVTIYNSNHNAKQRHPIQNHKPYQYPIFKDPGSFKPQYKEEYIDKNNWPINQSNKCKC